jgi:hypothetical protein
MNMKRKRGARKNGNPWPNKRAARAQWGPEKKEPKKADDGPWV